MFILYYFSTNYFSLFHCFFSLIFYRFSIIDSLLLTTFGQQLSYDSLINHILLNICIYYLKAHKRNYRYFSRAIRYLCKFMLFDLFYFFNTLALIFFQLSFVITRYYFFNGIFAKKDSISLCFSSLVIRVHTLPVNGVKLIQNLKKW